MSEVNTYLPGRRFLLTLSDDEGDTIKTLVCLTKQGLNLERATNKQDSQCGIAKAYGEVDGNMDIEAINNLTPDAVADGVGEASYEDIFAWFSGNNVLDIERKYPEDGSEFTQSFKARISKMSDAAEVANNMTFSFTLEVDGDVAMTTPEPEPPEEP